MTTRAREARRLLRRYRGGVLSTHSTKLDGYPYGAALPYCTDARGRIVVLVSHLAEHTKNIDRDPRVSFTVSTLSADLQNAARETVPGEIAPIEDEPVSARYLRLFPAGREYLAIGGFRFWAIEPKQVRLIAGFGSLHWIDGAQTLATHELSSNAEADVLEHMNADHAHNLRDFCRHVHGVEARSAQMVGIDCDGFDIRTDADLLRFDFDHEIHDSGEAREQLVALAHAAKA